MSVRDLLGHKSIVNTERYTRLVTFGNEKYDSATANTIEEERQLAEDSWEYFQTFEGIKVFRKKSGKIQQIRLDFNRFK